MRTRRGRAGLGLGNQREPVNRFMILAIVGDEGQVVEHSGGGNPGVGDVDGPALPPAGIAHLRPHATQVAVVRVDYEPLKVRRHSRMAATKSSAFSSSGQKSPNN